MTESIFFTVGAMGTAYWLDYLRVGRILSLAVTCLCVGLMVAIRPAGLAFVPMIAISLRLKWHQRNTSWSVIAAVVIVSLSFGPALEQGMYRAVHGSQRASIFPATMMGKAAMLVQQNTVFTGTHAAQLKELGTVLYATYQPVYQFLSSLPSIQALPIETAAYEVMAQRLILNDEILKMSSKTGVPGDIFRIELGLQAIRDNVPGYIRLSLIYYFGQWSMMALRFPPTSKTVNAYVASYPKVPLADKVDALYLRPPASRIAILIYPLILIVGGLTLVASLLFTIFIVWPSLGDTGYKHDLLLASFFAATVQIYTLLISFMNVPTPRYLIAVYPQIFLVSIFLFLAVVRLRE